MPVKGAGGGDKAANPPCSLTDLWWKVCGEVEAPACLLSHCCLYNPIQLLYTQMETLLNASKLLVVSCTNGHHQLGINLALNNASTWIHVMAHVHLHIQMWVCVDREKIVLFTHHLIEVVLVDGVFYPALSDGSHSAFPGLVVLLLLVLVKRNYLVSVLKGTILPSPLCLRIPYSFLQFSISKPLLMLC